MADTDPSAAGTSSTSGPGSVPADSAAAAPSRTEIDALKSLLGEARSLLAEIEAVKTRAAAAQGALDEHGTAAKKGAAELSAQLEAARVSSTEISTLTTSLQGSGTQAKELIASASASLDALKTLASDVSRNAATVEGLKAQVEQAATFAAERSKHIESGGKYMEKKRGEVDALVAATQKSATDAETQHQASRNSKDALEVQLETARAGAGEIANLAKSLQGTATEAKEIVGTANAALESLRSVAATSSTSAASIESLRTQAEQSAKVAAQRSQHVEKGSEYVDKKRTEVDALASAVQHSATGAETQLQATRTAREAADALLAATQAAKATTDGHVEAVANARAAAEANVAATKNLASVADTTAERIASYEKALAKLQEDFARQSRTIESLLLGATNAGLASAFDKRSQTFRGPEVRWQRTFFAALGGLLLFAAIEAFAYGASADSGDWGHLFRMLLHRLPFLVPLVWLAIHSARQASMAKRLEEEYAFKATISTSFEGYRRQMEEIGKSLAPDAPVARLCSDTLRTISEPPGRIYDRHRLDPTPVSAAADVAAQVVSAAKQRTE